MNLAIKTLLHFMHVTLTCYTLLYLAVMQEYRENYVQIDKVYFFPSWHVMFSYHNNQEFLRNYETFTSLCLFYLLKAFV